MQEKSDGRQVSDDYDRQVTRPYHQQHTLNLVDQRSQHHRQADPHLPIQEGTSAFFGEATCSQAVEPVDTDGSASLTYDQFSPSAERAHTSPSLYQSSSAISNQGQNLLSEPHRNVRGSGHANIPLTGLASIQSASGFSGSNIRSDRHLQSLPTGFNFCRLQQNDGITGDPNTETVSWPPVIGQRSNTQEAHSLVEQCSIARPEIIPPKNMEKPDMDVSKERMAVIQETCGDTNNKPVSWPPVIFQPPHTQEAHSLQISDIAEQGAIAGPGNTRFKNMERRGERPNKMDASYCGACKQRKATIAQYPCGHIVCKECAPTASDVSGDVLCKICHCNIEECSAVDTSRAQKI